MLVAMLVRKDVRHDNRVRREARSLAKLGHRVVVLAYSPEEMPPPEDGVEYVQLRPPETPRQRRRRRRADAGSAYAAAKGSPAVLARGAAYAWARLAFEEMGRVESTATAKRLAFWRAARPELERLSPDVVHAHDLQTLYAAARYGAPFVYDAHELEVYSMPVRTRLQRVSARGFERYGARRAKAVITVSDEIADEIARLHGIAKPYVVMNAPPASLRSRTLEPGLRERAGVRPDDRLLVYVGGVHEARGTSHLVDALPQLPERYHLAVVGPRNPAADSELTERAARLGVEARLHLLSPVAGDDVPALIAGADVSVLPGLDACRSYELTMPNKLFESLQAGVPIAVSDRWRSAAAFVREHGLGLPFDVLDPPTLAAAVEHAAVDPERLARAQELYSWETQERVLAEVYARV